MIRARQRQYDRYWQQYPFQEVFRAQRPYNPASLLEPARPPSMMEMFPYPFKAKYRRAPVPVANQEYEDLEETKHQPRHNPRRLEPPQDTSSLFRRTVMSVEPRRDFARRNGHFRIEDIMMTRLRRDLEAESRAGHDDGDYPYPRSLLPLITKEESRGLDARVICSFKVRKVGSKDTQKTCSICYSEFSKGESLMRLKCGHPFHPKCVRRWFAQSKQCPNCRTVQG